MDISMDIHMEMPMDTHMEIFYIFYPLFSQNLVFIPQKRPLFSQNLP